MAKIELITTLHKGTNTDIDVFPNIKQQNIPNQAIDESKLDPVLLQKITPVVANPTIVGSEADLTSIQVGDTKYKVSLYGINLVGVSSDGTKGVVATFITRHSYGLLDPIYTEAQYSTQSGAENPLTQDMLNDLINFNAFAINESHGYVNTNIGGDQEGQHNYFTFTDTEGNEVASIKFIKPTNEDCYVENELGYLNIFIQVI